MAKGELAEIYGPTLLGQDMLARITGYSAEELTEGYETLDPEVKEMIDGYVAGFNRRINETAGAPSQLPFEFHSLAQQLGTNIIIPEPWTGEDVLAWQAALLRQFDPEALKQGQIGNAALLRFLTDTYGPQQGMEKFDDLRWHNDPDATTYIPDSAVAAALPQQIRTARLGGALATCMEPPGPWNACGKTGKPNSGRWGDFRKWDPMPGCFPGTRQRPGGPPYTRGPRCDLMCRPLCWKVPSMPPACGCPECRFRACPGSSSGALQTAETIIVAALDNVLAELDLDNRPWGEGEPGVIGFNHPMFDNPPLAMNPLHEMPFSLRSTYAHVVEMADFGQARIESMLPLGQSGTIRANSAGEPLLDPHFTSMTEVFDDFSHRAFSVFEAEAEGKSKSSSGCFLRSLR